MPNNYPDPLSGGPIYASPTGQYVEDADPHGEGGGGKDRTPDEELCSAENRLQLAGDPNDPPLGGDTHDSGGGGKD